MEDVILVINYDFLYVIFKLGLGEKYELYVVIDIIFSVVVYVCESD